MQAHTHKKNLPMPPTKSQTGVLNNTRFGHLVFVGACLSERHVGRADMLVHRVHSCTVHPIRERAFLILGELRHRTGAAGTCDQKAHSRLLLGALLCHCMQETHTPSTDYRLPFGGLPFGDLILKTLNIIVALKLGNSYYPNMKT